MKIGTVILAAGYSSRMGDFKPLMMLGEKTLLAHGTERFRAAGIADVVVVTGHRHKDVEAEAKKIGISSVYNRNYDQGMFSSVRTGVREIAHCDGFFLLPVDTPLFHEATITTLLKNFDGRTILVPCFAGQQGHPPLIPRYLVEEIMTHDSQGGLRTVLKRQPLVEIEVWDRGILMDADTPDAFTKITARFAVLSTSELEEEEAMALARLSMEKRGVAHGLTVAAIALALGERLNRHGHALNPSLLYNGGLLHDIAKGEPDHEAAGGRLLAGLGFLRLADIVAAHRSVPVPESGKLSEKEVVCLADKLVRGTTRLSVRERFREKLDRFKGDAEAVAAITRRRAEILALEELIHIQSGAPVSEIIAGMDLT